MANNITKYLKKYQFHNQFYGYVKSTIFLGNWFPSDKQTSTEDVSNSSLEEIIISIHL